MSQGLELFTLFHVAISLLAILSGFVVAYGFITSQTMVRRNAEFLILTAATSLTGFLFPIHGFTPSLELGIISVLVIAVAVAARYPLHMAGPLGTGLRRRRDAGVLLQFLCAHRAVVHEGAGIAPVGADANRTSVQIHAADRALTFTAATIIAAIKFHPKRAAA